MNTRFSHPFEKWMDSALRNARDWRNEGERRSMGAIGRKAPSYAEVKHHKPHSTLKSSSRHGRGVQWAMDRARQSYRPMGSSAEVGPSTQSSRDFDYAQPRERRMRMSPSSNGAEVWDNSPWAVPPWSTSFGFGNRGSLFPMMDEFEKRMDDFERRIGMMGEDDPRGRSMIASSNDEGPSSDMQVFGNEEDPFAMMRDYLNQGSVWTSPWMNEASTELDAHWKVQDDGNLMLTMQMPRWMEAKDVRVDLEKGCLRLSGKRDYHERHTLKGTKTKGSSQHSASFRYEWPLDPNLKESDVHAHFDSSEGMLEVSIDVPPQYPLQEAIEGYKRDGAKGEDWVKIPVSSAFSASEGATRYREDVRHAEEEGMVEHQKQAVENALEGASSKLEEIGAKAKDVYQDAKTKAGEAMESAKETASDTMETAKEKVSDAFQSVTTGYKGAKKDSKKSTGSLNEPQAPSLDEM